MQQKKNLESRTQLDEPAERASVLYIYINRPKTFGSHCVRNSVEHRCSENLHNVAALPQIRISRNVGRADVPNKIIALYGCSNQSGSPLQPPPGFQLGSGRDGTALL